MANREAEPDLFHEAVRQALIKDGWTITDDPYEIRLLGVENDIDLGAERLPDAFNSIRQGSISGVLVGVTL